MLNVKDINTQNIELSNIFILRIELLNFFIKKTKFLNVLLKRINFYYFLLKKKAKQIIFIYLIFTEGLGFQSLQWKIVIVWFLCCYRLTAVE